MGTLGQRALTARQARFCREYVIDLNATQAAIRAGYSRKTAEQQGPRLLGNVGVSARIAELQAEAITRLELQADAVLRELARIGFSDQRAYVKWGPDGVEVLSSEGLTDDQAAAVAEVSQTVTEAGGTIRVKLHDKVAALDRLARHFRLLDPDEKAGALAVIHINLVPAVQEGGGK